MKSNNTIISTVEEEDHEEHDSPLMNTIHNETGKLYWARFYILFAFSWLNAEQNLYWITFGTVPTYAMEYYGASSTMIIFLSSLTSFVFVLLAFLSVWFIERYGIRKTMITSAVLMSLGSAVRCIHFGKYDIVWAILGQILASVPGPVCMILQPKLSNLWFGDRERTVATAVMYQSSVVGMCGAFLFALFVRKAADVEYLLYLCAAIGTIGVVLVSIYFPDQPPSPPTAHHHVLLRESGSFYPRHLDASPITVFKNSWAIIKNKNAFFLIMAGSLVGGFYMSWSTILVQIVVPLGFTTKQADWMGFYGLLAGAMGGILFGYVHDRYKHYKRILLVLCVANLSVYVWFSLATSNLISGAFWGAQVANILGGFLQEGPVALLYEGLVENTYPMPEQTAVNIFAVLYNIWSLVFLAIGSVVKGSTMNWILCGSIFVSTLCVLPIKEVYTRKEMGYHPLDAIKSTDGIKGLDSAATEDSLPVLSPLGGAQE